MTNENQSPKLSATMQTATTVSQMAESRQENADAKLERKKEVLRRQSTMPAHLVAHI